MERLIGDLYKKLRRDQGRLRFVERAIANNRGGLCSLRKTRCSLLQQVNVYQFAIRTLEAATVATEAA